METIVIVGGGAGGLELATRLGDALGAAHAGRRPRQAAPGTRIVLVDRWPGHFWKPLLHTVASGACDPHLAQVGFAAQAAEHHFDFIQGEVLAVNRDSRCIELAGAPGQPRRRVGYDTLVLALGAVSHYYGVPGAREHALTLDDVGQADAFRRRFTDACIAAGHRGSRDTEDDGRDEDNDKDKGNGGARGVHVAIVGGGATGVELAAELRHSAVALARYRVHALDAVRDVHITLIERGDCVLPHLAPTLSQRATRQLEALGVTVLTGTAVAAVDANALRLQSDGHDVTRRADLTLWAAGVEAPPLCATLGLPVNGLRQIRVDSCLRALGDDSIYAFGDCASQACAPGAASPPPRAQVAHQQAVFLARWLARPPAARRNGHGGGGHDGGRPAVAPAPTQPGFRYRDRGSLVSLGRHGAVGVLKGGLPGATEGGGWQVTGAVARLLYGLMYQKHRLSLHGMARTALQALVDWLRARIAPPVRLH